MTALVADIRVAFTGPLQWLEVDRTDYIFEAKAAREAGLYLWTVPRDEGEKAYYIGETGRSFAKRHEEHLLAYLGGLYRVYHPDEFVKNQKVLIWPGMWRGEGVRRASSFLEALPGLSSHLAGFLRLLRLYIAPLQVDARVRCRIEAALADHLVEVDGEANLQDTDIRYRIDKR